MKEVRKDFPLLEKNPGLIYLDSACTSLKPRQVIDAEVSYYSEYGACGGRSSHKLGRKTSEMVESCREGVLGFLNARGNELVFVKNTTEALNTVIYGTDYSKRRKVVTTVMEHHAVLLPLMNLRDEGKIRLEIIKGDRTGLVCAADWQKAIDRETALVVTNSADNTTGASQDVKMIARIAHDCGAQVCIDGAQGVPHHKTDFRGSDIDYLCFSGHKMCGPTGIGGLAIKKKAMETLRPFILGGGTVKTVTTDKAEPADDFTRFEAGVQHYAGIFGLFAACQYLSAIGMENIEAHEQALAKSILEQLRLSNAVVFGNAGLGGHAALFSFTLKGAKPHDIALMLDKEGIALRSGFFCAQPALDALGAKEGAVRASGYIYNTTDDTRKLGDALKKISALY